MLALHRRRMLAMRATPEFDFALPESALMIRDAAERFADEQIDPLAARVDAEDWFPRAEDCAQCHGGEADGMSVVPDLRRSSAIQQREAFRAVITGALADRGMPNFGKWISADKSEAIRAHIAGLAAKGRATGAQGPVK